MAVRERTSRLSDVRTLTQTFHPEQDKASAFKMVLDLRPPAQLLSLGFPPWHEADNGQNVLFEQEEL